eukprot:CAMPEP_0206119714 /NCGR_PEP_ID=MMETSP1472-20131121/13_1 /ASSEMBLY_ACC=CAM_ASM_001108 /TAXON_ID=41880 /ORGANISM="Pycnococcus provasolii, Strain RCC251" /LENGTH=52 /DNA_ID=CAMNT_0053509719 /DNA_START=165 /DNA_END=320 /DNA_ORIENTATION=+
MTHHVCRIAILPRRAPSHDDGGIVFTIVCAKLLIRDTNSRGTRRALECQDGD